MLIKKLLVIFLFSCLVGCSTVQPILESSDTFAACKTLDVVTTGYALSTGLFVEKNPFVAPLVSHGIWPLAIISFIMWKMADHYNNKSANIALNVVTCPVAAHNLWLLLH